MPGAFRYASAPHQLCARERCDVCVTPAAATHLYIYTCALRRFARGKNNKFNLVKEQTFFQYLKDKEILHQAHYAEESLTINGAELIFKYPHISPFT